MPGFADGPTSPLFAPLHLRGGTTRRDPAGAEVSAEMIAAWEHAPEGRCVSWGIPFEVGDMIVLSDRPVTVELEPLTAQWFVFLHTSDLRRQEPGKGGLIAACKGLGALGEHAADYIIRYADGTEARLPIRRRHQIGPFTREWGENCFQAVPHHKPHPIPAAQEQLVQGWGVSQTRASAADSGSWVNWLWAWENLALEKPIAGFRFEPASGIVVISAIAAGNASSLPLRWETRRKAVFALPPGQPFDSNLDASGLLQQIQLDLGQIISAVPRRLYPNDGWCGTYNNQVPPRSKTELLIEYTAHPDARFHLSDGRTVPVAEVALTPAEDTLRPVAPATQRVILRAREHGSGRAVAVKLHVHGEAGEYLAPVDRHRIINHDWFEDYSVDFLHVDAQGATSWPPMNSHPCTYIAGETTINLPLGRVYLEISKGFEIRPVRKVIEVTPATHEITIEVEKVLPWRERGWVTADTHVHFLSPMSALLEGAAEGVNVVNLLASQWGELMTNVGDFDGRTTWGAREAGGDGEYLVRVGTENRQHILGHISLLGYGGRIIAPMTVGGPDEAALGDPVDVLLTEWARQCKSQGGLVVLPHFPNPRAEHAASIISGDVDAVEMTSWNDLYAGIDPYSLSDWYRYLNCGYLVPAVGGTDKMTATTAVGTVRTYSRVGTDRPFTYETWMEAVRRGETFVTYGPLLDLAVDGRPMGSHIEMTASGGTVDVTWAVASVTVPVSRVELVINGEIRKSISVSAAETSGNWSVKIDRSSWLALLVRGHYPDRQEIIAAHSSPVMVHVAGSPMLPAADALTILDQIEGALAYLDTVGTRADDAAYKRMRLVLTSAHRGLHNRMHQMGYYHGHSMSEDHAEHH